MTRQTSIQLTDATVVQLEFLKAAGFGTQSDIIRIAIDRMYQHEKGQIQIRQFRAYNESITGEATDEELAAARACGHINAFRQGVHDVITSHLADLPEGWMLVQGNATHVSDPTPPTWLLSRNPILMGFVRVHHGDPHFPIWLYRQN